MDQPASQENVAERAGVSISTVSLVFSGKGRISPATRTRVLEVAAALNYNPAHNLDARRMVARRTGKTPLTKMFGMVWSVNNSSILSNSYYSSIVNGLLMQCWDQKRNLVMMNAELETSEMIEQISYVDGLVSLVYFSPQMFDAVRFLKKPLVTFLFSHPHSATISLDNRLAVSRLYEYLLNRGHNAIGYISAPLHSQNSSERFDSYRQILLSKGMPVNPDHVDISPGIVDYKIQGAEAFERLWKKKNHPTALIVYNDMMALGAMEQARKMGVRIPEDISLTGIDNLPESASCPIPLTTIDYQLENMGRKAIEILNVWAQDGRAPTGNTLMPLSIVERSSVRSL